MDSSPKTGNVNQVTRFDLSDEPSFQHKRRTSASPAKRYAREPNLPMRKKVPREFSDDAGEFFILGDQSKFRLDMIPYRARSLSAHRRSDSTDMLRWKDESDSDDARRRSTLRHSRSAYKNIARTTDGHYHNSGGGEPSAPRGHPRRRGSGNVRTDEPKNNENAPVDNNETKTQSPKRVRLDVEGGRHTEFRRRRISPRLVNSATLDSRNRKKKTLLSFNHRMGNADGRKDARIEREKINRRLRRHKDFLTKSEVGRFLNEAEESERREQAPPKGFPQNKQNNNNESEASGISEQRKENGAARLANHPRNSNESLGEAIVSRSNVANASSNAVQDEEINDTSVYFHRLKRKNTTEYQDKFQWRGDVVATTHNPPRNQPRLAWTHDGTSFKPSLGLSEYSDQFWPKSSEPLQNRHRNHSHGVIRDDEISEATNVNNSKNVTDDQVTSKKENNFLPVRSHEDDAEGSNGGVGGGLHRSYAKNVDAHGSRTEGHYKSEYSKKFQPPSDYLLIDGVWVKNAHVWRLLNDPRRASWGRSFADVNADDETSRPNGSGNDWSNVERNQVDGDSRRPHEELGGEVASNLENAGDAIGDSWFDYILELRRMAIEYRNRGLGINFSRDHLAQVKSNRLEFWDVSSTDSFVARDEEKLLSRKGANSLRSGLTYSLPRYTRNALENSEIVSNNNNVFSDKNGRSYRQILDNHDVQRRNERNLSKANPMRRQIKEAARSSYDDQDSSELSESLSSSLSLAEEVLERAQRRKNNLWTTK